MPDETEDERRQKKKEEKLKKDAEEMRKTAEADGVELDESELPKIPVIEPKKPVLMLLHLISITDMKFCA